MGKTLGQAEHAFILWRKRYIMILRVPPREPLPPLNYLIIGADESEWNSFSSIFNCLLVFNCLLSIIFVLIGPLA